MIAIGPYKHFIILKSYINRKKHNTYIVQCICGRERKLSEKFLIKCKYLNKCGCPKTIGKESKNYKGYKDISAHYFCSILHSAKIRKIPFNITPEEIWEVYEKQNKKCAFSNHNIEFNPSNGKSIVSQTASVDRIDSKKSYEKSNIQIVHKNINKLKNKFNEQLIRYLCKRVAMNNENKI